MTAKLFKELCQPKVLTRLYQPHQSYHQQTGRMIWVNRYSGALPVLVLGSDGDKNEGSLSK